MSTTKKHTSFTMKDTEFDKITSFLSGTQTVSQFCYSAMQEKIKRMEVRDKQGRKQLYEKDVNMFEAVIVDVMKRYGVIK